jgi:hypothetical protein
MWNDRKIGNEKSALINISVADGKNESLKLDTPHVCGDMLYAC